MKVDKDVPTPAVARGSGIGRVPKYPFRDMELGDSMFAAGEDGVRMWGSARTHSYRHKPFRVVARMVVENGVKGVRVWRVE